MLIKLVIISQNGTRSIPRTNIENNDSSFTPPEKLTFDNIPLQRNPQKFYSSDSEREREREFILKRIHGFARANERQYRLN